MKATKHVLWRGLVGLIIAGAAVAMPLTIAGAATGSTSPAPAIQGTNPAISATPDSAPASCALLAWSWGAAYTYSQTFPINYPCYNIYIGRPSANTIAFEGLYWKMTHWQPGRRGFRYTRTTYGFILLVTDVAGTGLVMNHTADTSATIAY